MCCIGLHYHLTFWILQRSWDEVDCSSLHTRIHPCAIICFHAVLFQIPSSHVGLDQWSFANRLPVQQTEVITTLEKFLAFFTNQVRLITSVKRIYCSRVYMIRWEYTFIQWYVQLLVSHAWRQSLSGEAANTIMAPLRSCLLLTVGESTTEATFSTGNNVQHAVRATCINEEWPNNLLLSNWRSWIFPM